MRKKTWFLLPGLTLLLALCLFTPALGEETEEELFVENQWDYVDEAISVSQGIPDDATGVLAKIKAAGVLRVATEPYFPPQEFIDPSLEGQDRFVGADMNMARLIAERMGVTLEIVPMDFSLVLNAVTEGLCDLAVSALSYTPERAFMVELSKGYYFSEGGNSGILIREGDRENIKSLSDLWDKTIAAQSSSLQETMMAKHVTAYQEFRRLKSMNEVYALLMDGRADAAMVDLDSARAYIQSNPDCGLTLVPDLVFTLEEQFQGDRVAAKKGELQLVYFVNGVIDELLSADRYDQWYAESEAYAARLGL